MNSKPRTRNNSTFIKFLKASDAPEAQRKAASKKRRAGGLMCITTGESPLVSETDGAGAIARVVDVEIEDGDIRPW